MTEPMTGIDRIREKVIAASKKVSLAGFARDVGIAPNELDAFIAGRSVPPPEILSAMAKWLFAAATFDSERNLLITGNHTAPPLKIGIPMPTYDPEWALTHGPRDWKKDFDGIKVTPHKHEEKAKPKRSGWLGGWI